MAFCQFKKLVRVAVLTTSLFVAGEASIPQSSAPSLIDEIQKVKSLVGGEKAASHDNIGNMPEVDAQVSAPHQLDDSPAPQEQSPQQQEFGPLASPEPQSSFFQGAVQEMSNLLASNRKMRQDLYLEQKERVKVKEELTNIAHMVEASNKRITEEEGKEQAVALANEDLKHANEDLKHSKTELEVSNGELLGAKTKLVAANSELQSINEKLQGINGKLQSTNSKLQIGNKKLQSANEELISKLEQASQMEKRMEQKALKAEQEAELMASQMHATQLSMQRTQDMVRKLFPSIKQQRGHSSQHEVDATKPTK